MLQNHKKCKKKNVTKELGMIKFQKVNFESKQKERSPVMQLNEQFPR